FALHSPGLGQSTEKGMSMATIEPVIETLNGLIETCKDGETGFQAAAEGVTNPDLKQLFQSYASQRALFATELQNEVQRLGGAPREAPSLGARLHRGWINIRSLVTGHDENAILAECQRSEE